MMYTILLLMIRLLFNISEETKEDKFKHSHSSALTFHTLQATIVGLLPESQQPGTETFASSVYNSFASVTQIMRKSTSPF